MYVNNNYKSWGRENYTISTTRNTITMMQLQKNNFGSDHYHPLPRLPNLPNQLNSPWIQPYVDDEGRTDLPPENKSTGSDKKSISEHFTQLSIKYKYRVEDELVLNVLQIVTKLWKIEFLSIFGLTIDSVPLISALQNGQPTPSDSCGTKS